MSAIFFLTGCKRKIEITAEYIINETWTKEREKSWHNSIEVMKMKVKKDSVVNPFGKLSQSDLLAKLEDDSSFLRFAKVKIGQGENYSNKKIFFNKYNGFYWESRLPYDDGDTTKSIGALQPYNWYKFSDLGLIAHPYFIFVYVDSVSHVHGFNVNLPNY